MKTGFKRTQYYSSKDLNWRISDNPMSKWGWRRPQEEHEAETHYQGCEYWRPWLISHWYQCGKMARGYILIFDWLLVSYISLTTSFGTRRSPVIVAIVPIFLSFLFLSSAVSMFVLLRRVWILTIHDWLYQMPRKQFPVLKHKTVNEHCRMTICSAH